MGGAGIGRLELDGENVVRNIRNRGEWLFPNFLDAVLSRCSGYLETRFSSPNDVPLNPALRSEDADAGPRAEHTFEIKALFAASLGNHSPARFIHRSGAEPESGEKHPSRHPRTMRAQMPCTANKTASFQGARRGHVKQCLIVKIRNAGIFCVRLIEARCRNLCLDPAPRSDRGWIT